MALFPATIENVVQAGIEQTPGTSVVATKLFQSLSIEPSIQPTIDTFTPQGAKFMTIAIPGEETVSAKISGKMTYDELTYVLASVLTNPTPAQIVPTTGLAYSWEFVPNQSAVDSPVTYTIEQGSSTEARKFSYGLITDWGFTWDRSKVELSGTMLGQAIDEGITLTPGLTGDEVVPIAPDQICVFVDDTATALGTTQIKGLLSGSYDLSSRFGPVWTVDCTVPGFAGHVETAPKPELKLMVATDAAGMAFLTQMRNGGKKFIRLQATGPNIETDNDNTFTFDMCGQVTNAAAFSDTNGVYAIEWTLTTAYDPTWGKAMDVKLINTLAAL